MRLSLILLAIASATLGVLADSPDRGPSTTKAEAAKEAPAAMTFDELFVKPYGPKGLEYTEKARKLAGHRVRIEGYLISYKIVHTTGHLVKFNELVHGGCILAPAPVQVTPAEYGQCDDLPACAVFLREAKRIDSPARAPLYGAVTGTFEIGAARERDERTSWLRLAVDTVEALPLPKFSATASTASTAPLIEPLPQKRQVRRLPATPQ